MGEDERQEGETERRCDGTIGCCRNINIEFHTGKVVW
jgi:hypothetical protein